MESVPDHVRNFMYEMRSSAWDLQEGTPCTATAPCPDFSESRNLVDELREAKLRQSLKEPVEQKPAVGSVGYATSQLLRMHSVTHCTSLHLTAPHRTACDCCLLGTACDCSLHRTACDCCWLSARGPRDAPQEVECKLHCGWAP